MPILTARRRVFGRLVDATPGGELSVIVARRMDWRLGGAREEERTTTGTREDPEIAGVRELTMTGVRVDVRATRLTIK